MKFLRRMFFLYFVSVFLSTPAIAQSFGSSDPNPNAITYNATPASPTVAALGKYIEIPVNKYTGTAEIAIPIFEIRTGSLSLPISLSYHSSGMKLVEAASWIGMGWSLNAGGIITRIINDVRDERNLSYVKGYLTNPEPLNSAIDDDSDEDYNNDRHSTQYWYDHNSQGEHDFEPDLFYYNFNGNNGKFVFSKEGIPVVLNQDNIKIDFETTKGVHSYDNITIISNFTVILKDGTKYYFEDFDFSEFRTWKSWGTMTDAIPIPQTDDVAGITLCFLKKI